MIPDTVIADHVLALYEYEDAPRVTWAHLESPFHDYGIRWGLALVNDCALVILRGTATITDTVRDLLAVPDPIVHHAFGPVHAGFYDGMPDAWDVLKLMLKRKAFNGLPVIVAGHSLGGAHAAILCGLMVLDGVHPARRVTFGEPRSGFQKLQSLLSPIPTTLYHNAGDIIQDLPLDVPLFPYIDSYATRTEIRVKPHGMALLWGPFSPHHMRLYREGLS